MFTSCLSVYQCPVGCGQVFNNSVNLNQHVTICSGNAQRPYKCSCNKTFVTKPKLKDHRKQCVCTCPAIFGFQVHFPLNSFHVQPIVSFMKYGSNVLFLFLVLQKIYRQPQTTTRSPHTPTPSRQEKHAHISNYAKKQQTMLAYFGSLTGNMLSQYKCSNCQKAFLHQEECHLHQLSCNKYFHIVCKKTFHSTHSYHKHFRNCPPKRFSCTQCKKSYSRKSDREAHRKKCCSA
jgi:hypothetical protein